MIGDVLLGVAIIVVAMFPFVLLWFAWRSERRAKAELVERIKARGSTAAQI